MKLKKIKKCSPPGLPLNSWGSLSLEGVPPLTPAEEEEADCSRENFSCGLAEKRNKNEKVNVFWFFTNFVPESEACR